MSGLSILKKNFWKNENTSLFNLIVIFFQNKKYFQFYYAIILVVAMTYMIYYILIDIDVKIKYLAVEFKILVLDK